MDEFKPGLKSLDSPYTVYVQILLPAKKYGYIYSRGNFYVLQHVYVCFKIPVSLS